MDFQSQPCFIDPELLSQMRNIFFSAQPLTCNRTYYIDGWLNAI